MSREALIAWSLWMLTVLGTIAVMVFSLATQQAGTMGSPLADSVGILMLLAFPTVGAVVASRRPTNVIGWLFCLSGPALLVQTALPTYAQWELSRVPTSPSGILAAWLAQATSVPSLALLPILLLFFPTGRLPSHRWRAAVVFVLAMATLGAVGYALLPTLYILGSPASDNPVAIESEIMPVAGTVGDLLLVFVGFPVAALSLLVRLARARGEERQQLKWFAFAGAIVAAAFIAVVLSSSYGTQPAMLLTTLAFLGLPVSAGIAILRYRLYDIDLLINRTLVYGATSAALAATFFGGVLAFQTVLRPLTGGSDAAIALSTLVSFALFQPIRRRAQDVVDRRFNRSRYDAARTLEAFGRRLRDEVDLDALRGDLLGAVRETMAPAHASLWLRERR